MKSSQRRFSFTSPSPAAQTTVTFTLRNARTAPPPPPSLDPDSAAARIQSAYRAHAARKLYARISAVEAAADELEGVIQRQETVDAVRSEERERARMNEAAMRLLLELDSVPGRDPAVRDARRKLSRRIVELQEILDSIAGTKVEDGVGGGYYWEYNNFVAEMEEQICRERGGPELDSFCEQYLGFRCLQRFLSQP